MYGFKKGAGKAERKSFANGGAVDDGASPNAVARGSGMVRGPGTGTSDDVKDAVPPGTYIMPADSTQQIGPEALGAAGFRPGSKPKAPNIPGMGFGASAQVPVNLSSGEFRLSPEQVHAIGVQVLEGMKAATHAPVGEQGGSDGDDASSASDVEHALAAQREEVLAARRHVGRAARASAGSRRWRHGGV